MNGEYYIEKIQEYHPIIDMLLEHHVKSGNKTLVITLEGDLGSGKTTFTQELGRCLGVIEPITSPTFTVMKQYELKQQHFDLLVHIDAYRFETVEEAKPLRLEEVFNFPRAVVCVEWPERISNLIPSEAVALTISIGENEKRSVTVSFLEKSGRSE